MEDRTQEESVNVYELLIYKGLDQNGQMPDEALRRLCRTEKDMCLTGGIEFEGDW